MNTLSESFLGSFLALLGSFLKHFSVPGSTLGALWAHFLNQKSALGSKGAPRGATPEINSHFWRPFGALLSHFLFLSAKKSGSEIGDFFLQFVGHPQRSKGWAHMQSVRAGAAQTQFFIFARFQKIAPTGPHVGSILEAIFVETCNFE